MRVRKQKRHRKVVRFYSVCFGFREPYKVLCDGTFVHNLLVHRLTPADNAISRVLGGRALLFTTRCIIGELKSLGESHSEALQAAEELITARCDHDRRVSAMACIESVLGEANTEHFFVATQDAAIRKKYREVPGVPVIFGRKNALCIEEPSTNHREHVKLIEEKRLHMSESESNMLFKRKLKDGSENHIKNLPDENNGSEKEVMETQNIRDTARRMPVVADKSKFKRKRAKGPNPLSCKKKKEKKSPVALNQKSEDVAATKIKRIRKRKRAHKVSNPGDPGS